jgi:hypothetical protein
MLRQFSLVPSGTIKADMEIITSDGRRAGFVVDVASGEIITRNPARRIPLNLIRRVDDDDVYIAPRLSELERLQ